MSGDHDTADVVVHLHLRPGEALSGWAVTDASAQPAPFHGWLELMVVVDALRTADAARAATE